jgi:DNA-binding MarR family transcriptional regulator
MEANFDRSLSYALRSTSTAYGRKLISELESHGLHVTLPQWLVLVFLYHNDGQNQQRLGEFANKDKAGITRVVDVLEAQGMLRRQQDPHDRRANCIYITPEGKAFTEKLMTVDELMHKKALRGVSPQEQATAERVLQIMAKNLQ